MKDKQKIYFALYCFINLILIFLFFLEKFNDHKGMPKWKKESIYVYDERKETCVNLYAETNIINENGE